MRLHAPVRIMAGFRATGTRPARATDGAQVYWALAPYRGAYWVAPRYSKHRYYDGYWQHPQPIRYRDYDDRWDYRDYRWKRSGDGFYRDRGGHGHKHWRK
jgi:hypothetical protein